MKIVLLGHGKMGQEVERLINESSKHQVVGINLAQIGDAIDNSIVKKADVVIDFTAPKVVFGNIKQIASLGVNMVVGTTGWYDKLDDVKEIVKKGKIGLIYGQNFSIGANILFQLASYASSLTSRFGEYDVYGLEVHHTGKKDSPSGTALKLSKEIMTNFPKKTKLQTEKLDRQIKQNELHFTSIRGGRNPGFHQITFDSSADSITISHAAHGRRGFAEGALLAAEFINKKKGLFSFDEVLSKRKVKNEKN